MLYKTMVLGLLESRPQLHDRLLHSRILLQVLDTCSTDLRTRHLSLRDRLLQQKPGSNPIQITSEAMEIALKELEARLPAELPQTEPLSLDAAMAYLRDPSRPA
jgi:hypothetical protein